MSSFEKEKDPLPSRQCTDAYLCNFDGQNYRIKIRITTHSPGLAPSDFFLFPNLEKCFGGQRFTSKEEVIVQTEAYFEDLPKSFFLGGLKKLEKRLEKCIELKGDYVEKYKKVYTK